MEKKMSKSNNSGGVGFCGVLTIVFIALKLADKIDWSWWLVLAPSLVPAAFAALVIGILSVKKINKGQ